MGYEVVLPDADSTNTGLCAALGIIRRPRSLIDCFGGMVFAGGSVTCPVDDPTPLPDAELELGQIPDEMLGLTDEGIRSSGDGRRPSLLRPASGVAAGPVGLDRVYQVFTLSNAVTCRLQP